ncbi:MAG: sugar ABC transporter permease [Clostridiales bacterium]|nr:sugar ABC transporter permease [Clostridiales bacterium]
MNKKFRKTLEPHAFMTPSYIVLALFMGYPLLNCIRLAFSNYKLTQLNNVTFAGLDNFIRIFQDRDIVMIALNTVKFVAITLILQLILGFILAMALKKPFRGRGLYQGLVFLPWAFSSFVVGLIFQWMFNAEFGPIVDVMLKLGITSERISFLGSPKLALYTVVVALVWQGIPFFGIMLLAALQSVPEDLMEAAKLDGANVFQRFFHVTLPCIKPTLITTTLLRTVWIFNNTDLIYIMTKGGPANSSHTLASYMFIKAYSTLDFGYASALGVLFMLLLTLYTFFYMRITKFNREDA